MYVLVVFRILIKTKREKQTKNSKQKKNHKQNII